MKVVLFCGGAGMRLRGYSDDVPKPMVKIGTRPILWHLMKYYAHFGHRDFIICLGYLGHVIKEYFLNYDESVSNDLIWSKGGKKIQLLNRDIDDWTITFVETGANSNIGERLKAIESHLQGEEYFLANYGDGLSDVPLPSMIDNLKQSGGIASLLLVQPTASFDIVRTGNDGSVSGIAALRQSDVWINGGFFVMHTEIFDHIRPGEELVREPFQRLIEKNALRAYKYTGFWQCMDTFKDKQSLEELNQSSAPWKVWNHGRSPNAAAEEAFSAGKYHVLGSRILGCIGEPPVNKILVTGATGFIGSHLCRRLIAEGNEVWGVSRRPQFSDDECSVRWWRADLSDYNAVRNLVRKVRPEIVFHLASRVSGSRELHEVAPMFQSNLASTVNILLSTSECGCEHIVVAGSSEEPTQPNISPCSPYAAAKLSSTFYSQMFSELFKVRVVVPRIFMAYSPDQKDLSKLVPYTICSMLQGERPKISSGKRLVDWIYVDDVVEGLVRVGAASNLDKVTFDLGSGSLASVRSVVETIGDIVGNGTVPEFGALSDRAMEPERIADVSFMERRLSWKPSTLLRAGLEKTVEWYKMAKNIAAYACLCWGMWDPIFDLVNTLQSLSLAQG